MKKEFSPYQKVVFLWLGALLLGWVFDQIFWGHPRLIGWTIFIWLILLGGLRWLIVLWDVPPARWTYPLLVGAALFGLVPAWRREPLTVVLAIGFSLLLTGMAFASFEKGRWWQWTVGDYLTNFFRLVIWLFAGGWVMLREYPYEGERKRPPLGALLRGTLFTLPVVVFFAILLAEADPIFKDWLLSLLKLLRLDNLLEYLFRAFYIFVLGNAIAGLWAYALKRSADERVSDAALPWGWLGMVESSMVLGSVVMLFAAFLRIQFAYFFGGEKNVSAAGYTYAEYARRGFGELVTVAFFSFMMLIVLERLTRREGNGEQVFRWLSTAMILEVVVILVSAYQRLLLYETAYGFTRLRLYTHIFMWWMGGLLLAFLALVWREKIGYFALAALVAAVGFALTLTLVNVDGFIARQNLARVALGYELDADYLFTLTTDAYPVLAQAWESADLPDEARDGLGAALVCLSLRTEKAEEWHVSFWRLSRWQSRLQGLDGYRQDSPHQVVSPDGREYFCSN